MIKRIGLTLAVVAVLALGAVAASAQSSPEPVEDTKPPATKEAQDKGFVAEFDDFEVLIDEELSPELAEELNAETDALVEHLRGLGFTVDVETIEIRTPVFDEENQAIWEAIDDFYEAEFAAEVATWTDEEKAEWNAETDELVTDLAADGITVETAEIAPGVRDIVWTEDLEKALWEIKDDYKDYEDFDDEDLGELDKDLAKSDA